MSRAVIVETNLDFGEMKRLPASDVAMLLVHHTGGSAGDNYSAAEIHAMHQAPPNNWAGIGYHYVVRKDGSIERGRPRTFRGAHCPDYNWRSLGVHVGGNFEEEQPTQAQIDALVALLADLCEIYGLEPETIVGHRDCMATACPGESLYSKLPEIRERVREALAA